MYVCVCVCMYVCMCVCPSRSKNSEAFFSVRSTHAVPFQIKYIIQKKYINLLGPKTLRQKSYSRYNVFLRNGPHILFYKEISVIRSKKARFLFNEITLSEKNNKYGKTSTQTFEQHCRRYLTKGRIVIQEIISTSPS